ncbi:MULTISPECIES: efflux RND transporter periplasmic adaptor subunit [Modicisalibacter]|uniref:efflux RND transporter periplasmic adaptor subunit n=1 Tax=Modicisalibacter TaxID=574347 RepID=UPI00100AD263|nr:MULTISPECIES: efflux RND transporter periplasmic adaptor subunit [Halomonadaceae]MBZ9557706.1 efflux RND transporter periplasmic adaptor subunit [Modicisalibacter sp. R2A 31.J]MBZ9573630.1 efflux RND transporter periplasmic adaptor subunit [Modicisalibacter sp. MOD 31.J]
MLRSRKRWLLPLALAAVLAGCGEGDSGGEKSAQAQQAPPRPAQVMTVEPRDLTLDRQYPAMVRSNREVTVMGRVEGILEARHYEEGSRVEKGDLLYTIQPDAYQATVRQREADVQSAEAELYRTQRNADRYQRLYQQNSVSQQQLDDAKADLRAAQATLAQAKAALDAAKIDLSYTQVRAPASGMISLSQVNVGSLVQPPEALTTITPLDPLDVRFSLPAVDALALRQQRQASPGPLQAALTAPGTGGASTAPNRLEGHVDFFGARVDESTSTVQAEAEFANPDHLFLPGQFVRVSLTDVKRYDVFAVPAVAVTEGLKGPQVMVLDDKDTAQARFVSLGQQAGDWQIVSDGLEKGDRVIVSAIGSISPGDKIEPQPFDGDPETGQDKPVADGSGRQGDDAGQGGKDDQASASGSAAQGEDGGEG